MTDMIMRAVLRKAILDKLHGIDRAERDALLYTMRPGDRLTAWDGDTDLGMVYVTKPTPKYRITDPAAFLAWVDANRPDEIVTTVAVSGTFTDLIRSRGEAIDPATGEVVVPDGVSAAPAAGSPTLTVKPSAAAVEVSEQQIAALPQLTQGES